MRRDGYSLSSCPTILNATLEQQNSRLQRTAGKMAQSKSSNSYFHIQTSLFFTLSNPLMFILSIRIHIILRGLCVQKSQALYTLKPFFTAEFLIILFWF